MTRLPTLREFLEEHSTLWPQLAREDAYEIHCAELRAMDEFQLSEAVRDSAERAEIMEHCREDAEAEDRARHPEFNAQAQVRNPYDETLDTEEDEGVFHG